MAEMWYYTSQGKQMDPVSIKELRGLVGDGVLKPTDMVWMEGMPRWVRASSVKELFPDPASTLDRFFTTSKEEPPVSAVKTSEAASEPVSARKGATAEEEPQPRKNRRTSESDDDGDSRPSRRRDSAKSVGSNTGIIVFLVIGAIVLVGSLVGGVLILVFVARPGDGIVDPNKMVKDGTTYTLAFTPGSNDSRSFFFRKGTEYEITVRTQPKAENIDVDLVIRTMSGEQEAADLAPDSDCHLRWTPRRDGEFRLEVAYLNQMPGGARVQSVVTIREVSRLGAKKDPPKDEQPKDVVKDQAKEPPLPKDVLEGRGTFTTEPIAPGNSVTQKFRVRAGHEASIRLTVRKSKAGADFNLIVTKENDPNTVIKADTRPDVNANVTFNLPATEIVSVRIENASKTKTAGHQCTVIYSVSP